jgi:hypothetical protein
MDAAATTNRTAVAMVIGTGCTALLLLVVSVRPVSCASA